MKRSKALLSLILSLALVMQMIIFVPMFAEAEAPTPLYTFDLKSLTTDGENGFAHSDGDVSYDGYITYTCDNTSGSSIVNNKIYINTKDESDNVVDFTSLLQNVGDKMTFKWWMEFTDGTEITTDTATGLSAPFTSFGRSTVGMKTRAVISGTAYTDQNFFGINHNSIPVHEYIYSSGWKTTYKYERVLPGVKNEYALVYEKTSNGYKRDSYYNGELVKEYSYEDTYFTREDLVLNCAAGHKLGVKLYNPILVSGNPYLDLDCTSSHTIGLIPPAGKASNVSFHCDSAASGAKWYIDSYEGVEMSDDGILTITGTAAEGNVKVRVEGVDGFKSFPLEKIDFDFEDSNTNGFVNAQILTDENGNKYLSPGPDSTTYHMTKNFNPSLYGRYVVETKVKSNSVTSDYANKLGFKAADWIGATWGESYPTEDWVTRKEVWDINESTATVTSFVDGKLITVVNMAAGNCGGNGIVNLCSGYDLDDFRMYCANTEAPDAYNLTIDGCGIGSVAEADYSYFSVPGLEESATRYQWYISDSADADEDARTAIDSATAKTYTVDSTYIGKYLWVKVKPASGESLAGDDTWSAPVKIQPFVLESTISESLVAGEAVNITNTANITNKCGDSITLMLVTAHKRDNELIAVKVDTKLIDNDATVKFDAPLTVDAAEGDTVDFYIWDGTKLVPYEGLAIDFLTAVAAE